MYPFKPVVLSFTLCPALVGIFNFAYIATIGLVVESSDSNALAMLAGSFWFGILSAVTAMVLYGVPALGLALLYACLGLHRAFGTFCSFAWQAVWARRHGLKCCRWETGAILTAV
ncbi:hypothetical protein [Pseudomonas sp. OHS18]|uniref:hypothetical protein n=1 Tax=Pseudomonas sp. OHS18 TaxID=3399679 RepID=UPI003A8BACCB